MGRGEDPQQKAGASGVAGRLRLTQARDAKSTHAGTSAASSRACR